MDKDKLNFYRPSPEAKLNPCSDEVFKALFTSESGESRTALRCFLTAVLQKKVKDVQLRPNEPPENDENDRGIRFDLSCTFNDGEAADVEMQGTNKYHAFGARAEYLSARLLTTVFSRGDDWPQIPKIYQISLLKFTFDKSDSSAVSTYQMKKNNGHLLSGIQTVIFLELPKIDALGDIPPGNLNSVEKWCKFFIDADNPDKQEYIKQLMVAEGGIMEAKKTLDKISTDWILWKRELDREVTERDRNTELHYAQKEARETGMQEGMQEGKQEGIREGMRTANLETAQKLKRSGIAAETIEQCTGLTLDEISKL